MFRVRESELWPSPRYCLSAPSVSSEPYFLYYPTSKMAGIQSIKCTYDFRTPPSTVGPLPRWLSILNLNLFTHQPLSLTSFLQASLSATVQSERSAFFPPRRPPWSCSPLIEFFKQDLSIDILHNKRISCTHISSHAPSYRRSCALPIYQGEYVPTGTSAALNCHSRCATNVHPLVFDNYTGTSFSPSPLDDLRCTLHLKRQPK